MVTWVTWHCTGTGMVGLWNSRSDSPRKWSRSFSCCTANGTSHTTAPAQTLARAYSRPMFHRKKHVGYCGIYVLSMPVSWPVHLNEFRFRTVTCYSSTNQRQEKCGSIFQGKRHDLQCTRRPPIANGNFRILKMEARGTVPYKAIFCGGYSLTYRPYIILYRPYIW